MPARNLGERKSLTAEEGLDQQGYLLAEGSSPDAAVKTSAATDSVVGVNYFSTFNADDTEVLSDIPVPVIHDGYPLVLCESGNTYQSGDAVYVSANVNGVASTTQATDAVKVGNVVTGVNKDLTGASGPELVQIDITSNLGDS